MRTLFIFYNAVIAPLLSLQHFCEMTLEYFIAPESEDDAVFYANVLFTFINRGLSRFNSSFELLLNTELPIILLLKSTSIVANFIL